MPVTLWSAWKDWLIPASDGASGMGGWSHDILFVVLFCALLDDDTRLGGARLPTSLITDDGFDAVAFQVLPDRRDRSGARGNGFLGHLQRYEYGKSMEIGKRFHDVTQSVSCVSGAIGLFRTA